MQAMQWKVYLQADNILQIAITEQLRLEGTTRSH